MATAQTTLTNSVSTDALMRAFAQWIDALITSGGWTYSGDSGQADLTTLVAQSNSNTFQSAGYKIYAMGDAIQATKPVYMKVEYGRQTYNGNTAGPALAITIGTGTNGSGTITGTLLHGFSIFMNSANGVGYTCQGSAGAARLVFALFVNSNFPLYFGIERRKNSDLSDADTGIVVMCGEMNNSAGNNHTSRCIPFSGTVPPSESGYQTLLTSNNPSTFNNGVGFGLIYPMMGFTPDPPGLNAVIRQSSDFTNYLTASVDINGTSHTFIDCGTAINNLRANRTDSGTRLMIRYE
jgi:hypothetical protein